MLYLLVNIKLTACAAHTDNVLLSLQHVQSKLPSPAAQSRPLPVFQTLLTSAHTSESSASIHSLFTAEFHLINRV